MHPSAKGRTGIGPSPKHRHPSHLRHGPWPSLSDGHRRPVPAGGAEALRLRRLASAWPRPSPSPSSPPSPSPPLPLPTTTTAAPPPAASTISLSRQQLWLSSGCRRRCLACRCCYISLLAHLDAARGGLQIQCLLRAVALSCWWLAAVLLCSQQQRCNG